MPFQKISGNFVELSVDNYLGSIRAGSSISDLGFRTYREATPGVMPVSGTGGNPGISLTLNTASPLSGDADLRLVKDSANRQGEGFSVDFNIQNRHQSKVLQISFDMELISGNYTNPDLTPRSGTFSVVTTTCTVTASHSLTIGQAVNMTFPGGSAPASGLYTITSIVPSVSFSFTVSSGSGTGVACTWNTISGLRVYIIANPNTNPTIIEPVNTMLSLGIANQKIRHIASFQTNNSGNSYRMVIHIAKPGLLPWTVDFANFKIWEPAQSVGAVITDWQSYTPTFNWCTVSSSNISWRRIGGRIEIFGSMVIATISANPGYIPLPSGLALDTSRLVPRSTILGVYNDIRVSSTAVNPWTNNSGWIGYDSANQNAVRLFIQSASALYNLDNAIIAIGVGDTVTFEFSAPIAGWGSSVAMSSDSGDGRVIAVKYNNTTNGATTSTTQPIFWGTREYDTHSAVTIGTAGSTYASGNSWKFIAPISGYYRVTISFALSGSPGGVAVWVNNSRISYLSYSDNASNGSGTFRLNAGDILDVRSDTTVTTDSSTTRFISIEGISAGSQVIATSETVACSYWLTSNTASTTDPIPFNPGGTGAGRIYDTHRTMVNGTFTAPMSGIYLLTGHIVTNTSGNWIEVWINGIQNRRRFLIDTDAYVKNVYIQTRLLAGQTLQLKPMTSFVVNGGTLDSGGASQIEITRISL